MEHFASASGELCGRDWMTLAPDSMDFLHSLRGVFTNEAAFGVFRPPPVDFKNTPLPLV